MSVSLSHSYSGTTSVASVSGASGDTLIVVEIRNNSSAAVPGVPTATGLTFTSGYSHTNTGVGSSGAALALYYVQLGSSFSGTITGGANTTNMYVYDFTGTTGLDVVSGGSSTSSGTPSVSLTTAQTGGLLFECAITHSGHPGVSGTNVFSTNPATNCYYTDQWYGYQGASSHTVAFTSAQGAYTVAAGAWVGTAMPTPTLTPGTGTYTNSVSVSLSDTYANAVLYYTTDGSTPTTSSTVYTGAINITTTGTTVKVLGADTTYLSGYSNSAVASATYTINIVNQPFMQMLLGVY